MDVSDDGFSDCDEVNGVGDADSYDRNGVNSKGGGGALAKIEADLGLNDFLKRPSKLDASKPDFSSLSASSSCSAAKKRKKKKDKEKRLIGDPFAIDSRHALVNASSSSSALTQTPSSGLQQRLLPFTEDDSWMRKMGLSATSSGSPASSSSSISPLVVSFSSKRKGLSCVTSTKATTTTTNLGNDDGDDQLDLDMERTRLEILKYETQRIKGKKASTAKMKEYLESLGARPAKTGAYRNPEHRQNYVKKKTKAENKERRVRKEMGLKVDNHAERRKDPKNGVKKKRKELGAVSALGKWSDKTATLKVKKRSIR